MICKRNWEVMQGEVEEVWRKSCFLENSNVEVKGFKSGAFVSDSEGLAPSYEIGEPLIVTAAEGGVKNVLCEDVKGVSNALLTSMSSEGLCVRRRGHK